LPYKLSDLKGSFTKEVAGGRYESIPADIRNALEAQAIIHPDGNIMLQKDHIDLWQHYNMQAIQTEDINYFKNWSDVESEHPTPMEFDTPNIYPEKLRNLLRSNDPMWGRQGGKYGEFGLLDYVQYNKSTGLLAVDDIVAANQISSGPVTFEAPLVEDKDVDKGDATVPAGGVSVSDILPTKIKDAVAKQKEINTAKQDIVDSKSFHANNWPTGNVRFDDYSKWGERDKDGSLINKQYASAGLPGLNYIPTEKEIENMKKRKIVEWKRELNPETGHWFQQVPILGMLAYGQEQGAEGVVSKVPTVEAEINQFNAWINNINKMKDLTGDLRIKEVDIKKLLSKG